MRIAIIVEGQTEKAFMPVLREFLKQRLPGTMPKLDPVRQNGSIPTNEKLKKLVNRLLADVRKPADAVIALTDVYTGTNPPLFNDAADAIQKMKSWVGAKQTKFHAHAAQYEFEAWLLPYWEDIQRRAGHNKTRPSSDPENVNHEHPPSHRLKEIFEMGKAKRSYSKTIDAQCILAGQDLRIAAGQCPQLKAFLNCILGLCGGRLIE